MASVATRLIEEVTAHAQSDSLEDAREICADGTYVQNNLRKFVSSLNHHVMETFREVDVYHRPFLRTAPNGCEC